MSRRRGSSSACMRSTGGRVLHGDVLAGETERAEYQRGGADRDENRQVGQLHPMQQGRAVVVEGRQANRPSSTRARDRGAESTRSSRPSLSSDAQRFTCVTANAIRKIGRMPNIAPRKLALKSELPPLRFFSRSCRTGEPENSAPSLA